MDEEIPGEPGPEQDMPQSSGDQAIKVPHDLKSLIQPCPDILLGESAFQKPGQYQMTVVDPYGSL